MSSVRLSTSQIHNTLLRGVTSRQAAIAKTQQQLTTGNRISQGKDDPAAMAASQRLDHAVAQLDQFGRNSDRLKSRLEIQDTALGDAGNIMTRASELAIRANNNTISDADRQAIAIELRGLRESLLAIANRDDGNGRMLFAGTVDGVKPFTDNLGNIKYSGDDGQVKMDVGFDLALKDTNPGSQVFMRVASGDGMVSSSAGIGNTGTGLLASVNVTNPASWNNQTLTVRFTSASDYEVVDGSGNPLAPPVTGTGWTQGQLISANGVDFAINGRPEAGDTFTVEAAPDQDIFTTLEKLADAVASPTSTPAQQAAMKNALSGSIASLATAQDHLLSIRAETGSRLNQIDMEEDARSASRLSLKSNLSELRDIDPTAAISELSSQMLALDAAQATMVKTAALTVWNKL